jgi:predicted O-methyltransferase YrrM
LRETPTPEIVVRAEAAARRHGFALTRDEGPGPSCSSPAAGRVLAVLAAQRPGARIAEIGTGVGMGAAWLSAGMDAASTLVTVEVDAGRAAVAAEVLGGDERITVVAGDARDELPGRAPFDLLFLDGGHPEPAALIDLLAPAGTLVVDDVTPVAALPPDSPFRTRDPKRELFADPRLVSVEVVLPDLANSLLVGVRVPGPA